MTRFGAVLAGLGVLGGLACAGNRAPGSGTGALRSYDIVIRGRDSLSEALVKAFADAGLSVRRDVRGGGRSAAALVVWRFVDPDGRGTLEAQLADTRRGNVLATATIPADTLLTDLPARAGLLVRGLLAQSP